MIPILKVIESWSWNLRFRYAGVPVDFEELEINGSTTDEETLRSALLSVQRNGIALKGTYMYTEFGPINVVVFVL